MPCSNWCIIIALNVGKSELWVDVLTKVCLLQAF